MENQTILTNSSKSILIDTEKVLVQVITAFLVAIAGHTLQHVGFTIVGCIALSVATSICLYNLYKLLTSNK